MKKFSLLFCVTTVISGCQVISPEECRSTDWQSRGQGDGNKGRSANFLNEYILECKKANVSVDAHAWKSGYKKGLLTYCIAENGFRVGQQGLAYNGVCPNDSFLKNYNIGRAEYELEQRKQQLQSQITQLRNKLATEAVHQAKKELNHEIKHLEKRLDSLYRPNVSFEINL